MFFKGYCPTLRRENAINIDYNIQSSSLAEETQFLKGYFDCDSTRQCPNPNECPIYKSAPSQL